MMSSTTPHPRPSVLVVDDEAPICEAVATALRDRYHVHPAVCGAEAFALLQAHRIALIILDALLGPERGLDLVPRFRTVQPAPILLLTAHGSKELLAQALRLKVDEYQEKPISVPTLRATVDRLVAPPPLAPDLATRARQCLEMYPAKPFDPVDFAYQLGVSEVHLRRCFRATFNLTPHQYLTRARLQNAATLLRTADMGVEQIALTVGFPTVVWFNKCFRRAFNLTPQEYRAVR